MIKNPRILKEFEKKIKRKSKVDINKNFDIFEGLYKEALELGVLPRRNPLSDKETVKKIARIINSV
ncbi:hypothetical protein JW879_00300 [candidate division WOR-3 bacterium]|nr:hypothetical protein [candidate division WOR-3 bacterium]